MSSRANCPLFNRAYGRERNHAGFALVVVLWLLLMLSLVAAIMMEKARSDRQFVADNSDLIESRAMADGGVNRAILSLVNRQDPEVWRLDGTTHAVKLFDHDIQVQVESESGKIDLNAASAELLRGLFRSQGLGPSEASDLAEQIIAWRTPTEIGMPDTAANPYQEAGRPYTPRHGPFLNVDELRLVIGMTDDLQKRVAPLITVYSRSADIDRQVATTAVLDALAEMGDRLAQTQRDARVEGHAAGVERQPNMGEAVTIRAHCDTSRISMTRTAVVRLVGDRREPFWVLSWR